MRFEEYHPSEIPATPGVYLFRNRFGTVIYVGKARNLRRRLGNYFQPSRRRTGDAKLRSLINSIAEWSYQQVRTEDEALILESQLIKSYAPHYNILMRDDKRYLLLKVDMEERFPTLKLARFKKPDNALYFGPFPHGAALKATREFLLARFGLRACRNPEPDEETRKHCMKRLVRDCSAPCTGEISQEDYRRKVDEVLKILEGDISELSASLKEQMVEAAAKQNFEKAAQLRDVSLNIQAVFGRRNRVFSRPLLPDQERAPGREAVEALQKVLGLKKPPEEVICFDISNILGTLAVASMVVFSGGKQNRQAYRRFRIKTVHQSDDFAMMREAVTRHFSRLLAEGRPMPDLLVVDGGKGQLSSAVDAIVALRAPALPIISLAERNEEIFVPGRSAPYVLDRHNPALKMLQALRDEAHRFAITYHRNLREKRIRSSILDEIPGIGPNRKKALLREFSSLDEIVRTSPPEIAERIPGLGEKAAAQVRDYLLPRLKSRRSPVSDINYGMEQ